MRVVNPFLVAAVFEPFLFIEQEEIDSITKIDPENEGEIRDCIRRLLVPYFLAFDEKSKLAIRDSLSFMLIKGSDKWDALLAMNQCPLVLPNAPQQFFVWLWDELFHEGVHLDGSDSEYVVKEDIHAPNLIRRGKQ